MKGRPYEPFGTKRQNFLSQIVMHQFWYIGFRLRNPIIFNILNCPPTKFSALGDEKFFGKNLAIYWIQLRVEGIQVQKVTHTKNFRHCETKIWQKSWYLLNRITFERPKRSAELLSYLIFWHCEMQFSWQEPWYVLDEITCEKHTSFKGRLTNISNTLKQNIFEKKS